MKKLLLFFGLICMINLTFAQEMVTIHQNGHDYQVGAVRSTTDYPASNIQFWVGSGSNSIVAVFQWCQDETMGVAYGFHWDGTATVYDMLTAINAADSRFTITFAGTTSINTYTYQDDTYNEYLEEAGWLTYTINGNWCSGLSDALVNNGYFEMTEWGDCTLPTTNIIPATDPNASTDPVDASLPFSSLLYWVGSGSDSAEFIVNFANPDTAFAWGYLFNGSTTAQAMVDAIAAADPRFWTEGSPSVSGDIHFVLSNGDTLGLSPVDPTVGYNFWWTNLNGVSAGSGASSTLHNGDVFKYGDMNSAIGWDFQYGYYMEEAWIKTPTPVAPPTPPTPPTPTDATIAASDILYWVGNGNDSAIFVLNIDTTSVAWGYRFNAADEPTVDEMISAIDAADPRIAYSISWETLEYTFYYVNHPLKLIADDYRFKVNGTLASVLDEFEDYDLADNMIVVVSNLAGDTWNTPITPASVATMPVDATISAEEILYWVGEGSNEAVIAINWGVPDTALAWGLRFSEPLTVTSALQALVAAESRLTTDAAMSTFNYTDGTTNLSFQNVSGNYMQFILNGNPQAGLTYAVNDGAFLKVGESAYGVGYDSTAYAGMWFPTGVAWPTEIHPVTAPDTTPVNPTPVEATIAFSDILYWVGTGSNEAVLAVNWADTALAWGYRWNGDATVADMMAHIAAADPRFSYTGTGYISDINYIDTAAGMTSPLGITPGNYWGSTNNGVMDWGMSQSLNNGDLEKWADSGTGILVDSVWVDEYGGYWNYIYVYPMTIYPVTVPDTTGGSGPDTIPEHGPFCGAVGTDGCNAIAANDNQFVAWATGVVLTRGPQMITSPDGPFASFGGDTNAIGPATLNNTMDAVSLGDGGSALVTFERPIRNGEGPDFAVFENSFNDSFLELAFVEVSSDGEHFVRFPATSLTPTDEQVSGAVGGVDPTMLNNLAGKFRIGYGTPFDLEELAGSENLDIDSIVYVRIIDAVGTIDPQYATYDAFGHIVNDPWPTNFNSSGFDLTGVGVIHQKPVGIENHDVTRITVYPNPCSDRIYVNLDEVQKVELYNMNGQLLEMIQPDNTHFMLDMQRYPAGMYLLKVGTGVQKIMKR